GESGIPLLEVEAVTHVELVGDGEADVADGEVVDEPAVGPVEEGHGRDRAGSPQVERAHEVVEREPRVDDVLHDEHVAATDVEVEVLEHADLLVPAHAGAAVTGELDEVEGMEDPDGA